MRSTSQAAIDQAWAEEAERRVDEIDSGKARLIPGEEVFARLRVRYGPDRCQPPNATRAER